MRWPKFNLPHDSESASQTLALDQARAEARRLRETLLAVSTDLAQDALEDPIGHAERRAGGFVRLAASQADAIQMALRGCACVDHEHRSLSSNRVEHCYYRGCRCPGFEATHG